MKSRSAKHATNRKAPLSVLAQITRKALLIGMCGLPLLSYAQTPLKAGAAYTVNSFTENSQSSPAVSKLNNGGYIFAWSSYGQDGNSYGIYAQRFNAVGQPLGDEFKVNSANTYTQPAPQVAQLNDGSFVIVWRKNEGAGRSTLHAKRFQANGSPLGNESVIHNGSADFFGDIAITPLSNGGYIVSMEEKNGPGNEQRNRVKAQVFDANGNSVGSEIAMPYNTLHPAVASTNNGGLVIAWQSAGDAKGVFARRYDADGKSIGAAFPVSQNSSYQHSSPAISRLNNGDLIVTWQSSNQTSIYARRFDDSGTAKGTEFRVNTHSTGTQETPTIDALENGGYVISWVSDGQDGSEGGVFAQTFSAEDSKVGEEIQVNTMTDREQLQPVVSVTGNNDFVIGWRHEESSGNYDIRAQRFQLEAVQADTMTLSMPQSTVLQGDVITLPLHVSGTDIYGLDAVVSVSDTTKARISGGEYGEFLPSDERLSVPMGIYDSQWDGALALMAPATAKSGEGEFAAVTLIAEQAGTVNLTLQAQMTDSQGNYLLQNSTDYTFTIAESVTLTGNISSLSTAGDYIFVTLLINGQRVTINPDGSFSVRIGLGDVTMALSAPGYLTAEKQVNLAAGQADIDFGQINLVGGDSNGDNHIDIADLTLLLGAYRSVEGHQNGYVMAADFNRDGAINLRDLTLLGANFGKQGPQSW